MIKIVSIGIKEIFLVMKLNNILNFTIASTHIIGSLCSSLAIPSSWSFVKLVSIGNHLFGILTLENTCWSFPQIWFSYDKVASSSLTKTPRKFMVVVGPFVVFFQHRSFIWPKPKQKNHFRPQLSILCPSPHLEHFGLVSISLRHVRATCFSELHNWQQLLLVRNVALGPALPLVIFPKKLMRISFNCQFVVDFLDAISFCSSFMGSYGVSPSCPNTFSILVTTITTSSMSV